MWPNPHFPADLVTFTEEIRYGKLFFCAVHGFLGTGERSRKQTEKKYWKMKRKKNEEHKGKSNPLYTKNYILLKKKF